MSAPSFCNQCGAALARELSFCRNCGAQVAPAPPAGAYGIAPVAVAPPPLIGRRHWPIVALVLALLIPGAGQAYNGQPIKAFFLLFFSVLILPWLYSLFDAFMRARQIVLTGGRMGKGGFFWVFMQIWLAANVVAGVVIGLTIAGRMT